MKAEWGKAGRKGNDDELERRASGGAFYRFPERRAAGETKTIKRNGDRQEISMKRGS